MEARFADPLWLVALVLIPWLLWLRHRSWRPGALVFSHLPVAPTGRWRLHVPWALRVVALTLIIVAIARPQLGLVWEETTSEGIDIQLVLDVSGSMGAEDFEPENRLTVAKHVMREFVEGRTGDRIGFIVFAGTALTKAPPTTDRSMLQQLIDDVELYTLPEGTAIGVAMASAASRLKGSPAESRVVVLVTDGDNNAGQIDPDSAAAVCAGLGIKVYTVAVGTKDGPVEIPVPQVNERTGEVELVKRKWNVTVNEELLQQISERTGATSYVATDADALRRIFAEIDELERTPILSTEHVRYRDVHHPLLWSALAFLVMPLFTTTFGLSVEP